jgi:hypothetical protein
VVAVASMVVAVVGSTAAVVDTANQSQAGCKSKTRFFGSGFFVCGGIAAIR